MGIEIEAKMRLHDVAALEKRLEELGARRQPGLMEINTYFDTPQSSLKAADQGLRLRVEEQEGGGHRVMSITHKGPRAHGRLKSRSEVEFQVSDARAAVQLLSALGFVPVFTFEKRRQPWEFDGCAVAIDHLPYLGDFVEIQGPRDQAVLAARERLGLASAPLIHASYISILMAYLAERRITTQYVELDADQPGAE